MKFEDARRGLTGTAGAWAAFMTALVIGQEVTDVASFVVAGLAGGALVLVGFLAVSRVRPIGRRTTAERGKALLLAVGLGFGLGLVNLGGNLALAKAHPAINVVLTERFARLRLDPLSGLVFAPVVEEIALRLVFLSVVAWIVSRFTARPRAAFLTALTVSSLVFALLHLDRAFPADPTVAAVYAVGLVAKYTIAGLVQGWIFWRCGLPYAMVSHSAVNGVHLALQRAFF
jgi:hypothetical protein